DLVDHAAVIDHDAGNTLEILAEHCHQILGAGAMRRRGETLDVSEQRGDLTPFAIELDQVWLFDDASNDRWREMLFEPTAHERFPPACRRVGCAGSHREHHTGGNRGARRID